MVYDKIQDYIDLANKIFEYFNGRINKVNNNVKFIISPEDKPIFGEMHGSICLKLYIYSIIERSTYDLSIKHNILFTIIHELFHADQCLYFEEYNINKDYVDMIEAQVNFMTTVYLINNKIIMEEIFGFPLLIYNLKKYLQLLEEEKTGIRYRRIYLFDYYYQNLRSLFTSLNQLSDILYYASNINFYCNNNFVIIKKDNIFIEDTNSFRDMVYDNYYRNRKKTHTCSVIKKDGIVCLISHTCKYPVNAIEFL